MEGRLAVTTSAKELELYLNLKISPTDKKRHLNEALYNVAPSSFLPVITNEEQNKIRFLKWGLIPSWKNTYKNTKGLSNINLSSFEGKPALQKALNNKHCLVYVTGFYIWKDSPAGKIPYYITLKSKKIFGISGIWESWEDEKIADNFCIITKKPEGALSYFQNEIPAAIKEEASRDWLANTTAEVLNEQNFIPEIEFEYYPVNQKIIKSLENNPKFIQKTSYIVGEQTNLF